MAELDVKVGVNTVRFVAAVIAVVTIVFGLGEFNILPWSLPSIAVGAWLATISGVAALEVFVERSQKSFDLDAMTIIPIVVVVLGVIFAVVELAGIAIPSVLEPLRASMYLLLGLVVFIEMFTE